MQTWVAGKPHTSEQLVLYGTCGHTFRYRGHSCRLVDVCRWVQRYALMCVQTCMLDVCADMHVLEQSHRELADISVPASND